MIVVVAIVQPFVDPRLLMLDPMVAAEESGMCCRTYYGIMSTLGVLGWFATMAITAFAAAVLIALAADRKFIFLTLFAAGFTGMLGFDDAFLFHENLAQKIGIAQNTVLAAYGLLAVFYMTLIWQNRRSVSLVMIGTAGIFLAASLGLDVVLHSTDPVIVSLEDGAKFIGICCWLGFHVDAMFRMVVNTARQSVLRPGLRHPAFGFLRGDEKAVVS